MSEATITAEYEQERRWVDRRRYCDTEERRVWIEPVGVSIRVECAPSDWARALEALDRAKAIVEEQLISACEREWAAPRAVGSDE